ncbi:MAG: tyrosine-type recombinase/integrase [Pseudonocardiaceae bacterium]
MPKVSSPSPHLPRGLPPGEVAALLESCDRGQRAGLWDVAMLTLMSRVGLRAGEVAGLRLDNLDWRSTEAPSAARRVTTGWPGWSWPR